MLKDIGIKMCMVGHSERRKVFGETNQDINRKLVALVEAGIYPILAFGDEEEDWTKRRAVLVTQLRGALGVGTDTPVDITKIALAYEPVWAISTWRTNAPLPTGKEVFDMLELVRDIVTTDCKLPIKGVPTLFGGSVAPNNADEYFAQPNCDGALVGGASLKVDSLLSIYNSAQKAWMA